MSIPTFREWMRANRPHRQPIATPLFTPTDKRPGDKVLGAGGKWSVAI